MLQTKPLFLSEKEELEAMTGKEGSLQSSTPCWETARHQGSIQHSWSATTTLTLNGTEKDLLVFEGRTKKHLQPWWDRERTVQPPNQQQKQATEECCSLQCSQLLQKTLQEKESNSYSTKTHRNAAWQSQAPSPAESCLLFPGSAHICPSLCCLRDETLLPPSF